MNGLMVLMLLAPAGSHDGSLRPELVLIDDDTEESTLFTVDTLSLSS